MTDIATATLERSQEPAPAKRRDGGLHTRLRRVLLLAVIFSFAPCLAVDALVSKGNFANSDLWWHLSTGAWIAQHHAVPTTDPFSLYGMNKPWVAYGWLFELPLYGFYRWLGLVGTAVFVLPIVAAIGLALYRAMRVRTGGFVAPAALTVLGLFLMARLYTARPWLFSILFFVIETDVLFSALVDRPADAKSRRLWLLPVLFALWANIHVQFVYGLGVLGLAALTQNVDAVWTNERLRIAVAHRNGAWKLWLVTGVSFLATLINPYSWQVYKVILEYATERAPFLVVTELRAPDFRSPLDYILVVIVLSAALVLGRGRLRSPVFASLLLISTTLVSLRMVRDEWFALVVALLIIASALGKGGTSLDLLPRAHRFAATALAVLLIFAWAKKRDLSNTHFADEASSILPVKAADVVLQRGLQGPLYNDFEWGGYLIWRLPGRPVSMDGRTNIYGDARIARSIDTWNCRPGWETDPELAAANLIIGDTRRPLSSALKHDSRYELAYEDKTAVVFVKRPGQ